MLSADALELTLRKSDQGVDSAVNLVKVSVIECYAKFLGDLKADLCDIDVIVHDGNIVVWKCVAHPELFTEHSPYTSASIECNVRVLVVRYVELVVSDGGAIRNQVEVFAFV
jgi:hypothetical protein